MNRASDPSPVVLTIGHSTRTVEDLIRLLRAQGVTRLVDVRAYPRSRRNPQFNYETLPELLATAAISYTHLPGLGGRRRPRPNSPNVGWRNTSFQAFADYMQTPEFEAHLEQLVEMARHERIALMCAEAVPWRCHRSIIADALLVRGIRVEHILGEARPQAHTLTPWARVDGTRITYPAKETRAVDSPVKR